MATESARPQLVVIGASAGGIEALSTLVATLPTPFPAPIVIAQHLDPSRPSHLGEILTRRAPIPVVTVSEHEQLQAGTVYVVPSNHHIEVTDHDITLQPQGPGRPKPSIDLLLSSAAEVYGERLVAVILTGTGSDGAMGARAVKQAGGTVVIQNPGTAAYPGMPQAVEPQIVDIVADLPRIGPILFDLLTGVAVPTRADAERELVPFLGLVREHTGIDFSSYKTPTILRRLQRRILAAGVNDLAEYAKYLQHHPDEYQRLAGSFLIKVTDFMRDQELFDVLQEKVIPDLVAASRNSGNELRLWSAGCATGQEAYSLAILVLEALGDELPSFPIKIFATDLDSDAIAFARRGLYPPGTLAHMPEDLVARYFTRSGRGCEVKKQVRSLVVFGEHDLGHRAPFPRIAMVLCRNVLIYFTKELQQRALQLFAFSLREGGYLVLGKTETASPAATFFAPELPNLKIYRRQGTERPTPPFPIPGHPLPAVPRAEQRVQRGLRESTRELFQAQQESLQARMFKENLLLHLPIGVVVVDRRYDIQEINNAARRLLGIHTVAIGEDLLHLAQNVSNKAFRAAIDRALREKTVTKLNEVQVPQMSTGEPTYLRIECYPRPAGYSGAAGGAEGPAEGVLVLIVEVTETVQARREMEQGHATLSAQTEELRGANAALTANNAATRRANADLAEAQRQTEEVAARHAQQIAELAEANRKLIADTQEVAARHVQQIDVLAEANRDLLAANQEVTRANSELRATLDDLLMTHEESQAAIEEVETLNEEVQATNEELETLNEEMQATVEELNTSNTDLAARGDELQSLAFSLEVQKAQLEAILAGLADAVLVVSPEGKPLLMNAAYRRLFGGGDAGAKEEGDPSKDGDGRTAELAEEDGRPLLPGLTPQARAARGETFSMTFTLTRADGERHWCEALGQPVRDTELLQGGIVVIRDITERNLRRLQEEFLALASHELRSPVTTISATLQLLARWHTNRAESERPLRQIGLARSEVTRLLRLIDDLLDASRLQTGKFALRPAPLRLDTLVADTVEIAQSLTSRPQIGLDVEPGVYFIQGDADRLQQLVLNLLTNAMTYAAESPRIDVRLRRAAGCAEIVVADTGAGIAAADLPHLFSRFFQVTNGATQGRGLGLGLYLCQEIVTAHGGTITVESTLGAGTTFRVQLPLSAA